MRTTQRDIGREAWKPLPYVNGYKDFSGEYQVGRFRRDGGDVVVEGLINVGTANATAWTFPPGYRPSRRIQAPYGSSQCEILANGVVTFAGAAGGSNVNG